jgi:hypothetical protein
MPPAFRKAANLADWHPKATDLAVFARFRGVGGTSRQIMPDRKWARTADAP